MSTPLAWDELSPKSPPEHFNVRTIPQRLADLDDDPWQGYRKARQSITASMLRSSQLG